MFLKDILHIGSQDMDFINQYYAIIADIIDFSHLLDIPLKYINANTIISEIFNSINGEVFNAIKEQVNQAKRKFPKRIKRKLLQICDDRIQQFSPFLNCLDSWFQNELDRVTILGREIDDIAGSVLTELLEYEIN